MATRTRGRARPRAISDAVRTGDSPGSPNGTIAPVAGTQAMLTADLAREYVASSDVLWYANYARSLPHPADDLSGDFGIEVYESMARKDSVIAAGLQVLKTSVLEDIVTLAPAVEEGKDPLAAQAQAIADFCSDCLDTLSTPFSDVLWDMMDALVYGSRVAELVYSLKTMGGAQRLALTAVKVKPARSTSFVVDAYHNVLGLLAQIPGVGWATLQQAILDPAKTPNILPREKFAILSFRPRNGDPRGTSLLRSVYTPWWQKMQVWPLFLQYMTQFSSPIPVGTVAPDSVDMPDPVSGAMLTPQQFMLAALQGVRAGAAIAVPAGATVQLHYSQGGAEAFIAAFDHYDRQVTIGLLSQTLATGEGRHNARAAAQVHLDILELLIKQLKQAVIRMIHQDILTPLVKYNFGEDAAQTLVPKVSLGQTEEADASKLIAALATVEGFKILPSQLPDIYSMAGLPDADPEELAALIEATAAGQQAAQQLAENPPPVQSAPPAPPPPKPEPPVPKKEAA